MAKCWQLLTWDIPLKLMQRHRDDKAKAVVLEAKKDYVKPKGKASCPKCGGELDEPLGVRRCDNWERDGVFEIALRCTKCGWHGQGGCVLVEMRG